MPRLVASEHPRSIKGRTAFHVATAMAVFTRTGTFILLSGCLRAPGHVAAQWHSNMPCEVCTHVHVATEVCGTLQNPGCRGGPPEGCCAVAYLQSFQDTPHLCSVSHPGGRGGPPEGSCAVPRHAGGRRHGGLAPRRVVRAGRCDMRHVVGTCVPGVHGTWHMTRGCRAASSTGTSCTRFQQPVLSCLPL